MGTVIKIKTEGYNGHKSWDHWNVALWLSNDEWWYEQCMEILEAHPDPAEAAGTFLWFFKMDGQKTPDGAEFNLSTVTEALRGLSED
jgi:hypothetical protein